MRARNIKPGFFSNEYLAECDFAARLLFSGLWCMADREGRLEDRAMRIKAELLPYDNVDVNSLLDQLAKHGFIVRYQVSGKKYIEITNFKKHQRPHSKESLSNIPGPDGESPKNRKRKRYIYFFQAKESGPIKIGSATNPEQRASVLQTGNDGTIKILGVIETGKYTEGQLHSRFDKLRVSGEWFKSDIELLSFIKSESVPWEHVKGTNLGAYKQPTSTNPSGGEDSPGQLPAALIPDSPILNSESGIPHPSSLVGEASPKCERPAEGTQQPSGQVLRATRERPATTTPSDVSVWYLTFHQKPSLDSPQTVTETIESMLEAGHDVEEIIAEMRREGRDRSDRIFHVRSALKAMKRAPPAKENIHDRLAEAMRRQHREKTKGPET